MANALVAETGRYLVVGEQLGVAGLGGQARLDLVHLGVGHLAGADADDGVVLPGPGGLLHDRLGHAGLGDDVARLVRGDG